MMAFRLAIFAALLGLAAACASAPDRVAPETTPAALATRNEGVVATELFASMAYCRDGRIGLGPEDGTKITGSIDMGMANRAREVEVVSRALPAGTHHILKVTCGGAGGFSVLAKYRQRESWGRPAIYDPLASFTVGPGEVLYIGSLHATGFGGHGSLTISDRSAQVRAGLAASAPALADAMVVRLAEGLRTREDEAALARLQLELLRQLVEARQAAGAAGNAAATAEAPAQ